MGKKKEPEVAPKPIPIPGTGPDANAGGSSSSSSGQPQAFAGFKGFSETGGFSPGDLANIRARAVSPVRAVYANAQRNVNRQKGLQGGYAPGAGALQSRMAREQGQETADAGINAEAGISEMVQKGKLAGLQGMAQTEGSSSSSSGGGGKEEGLESLPQELVPEKKKGFWGKFGGALKKIGSVGLPIALNYLSGGASGAVGKMGTLKKIASAAGGKP